MANITGREYVVEVTAAGNEVDGKIKAAIEDQQEMRDLNHNRNNLRRNMLDDGCVVCSVLYSYRFTLASL